MRLLILGLIAAFTHTALAGPPIIWNGSAAKILPPSLIIPGSTSGALTINPAATTNSYSINFPADQGDGATTLKNDGSGNLTFGSFVNGQMLYVDGNRSDTYTADGSIQRPFKTIQACLNAPTDASSTKEYVCVLAGNQAYNEQLTLTDYVDLTSFNNAVIEPLIDGASVTASGAVHSRLSGVTIYNMSSVAGDPALLVSNSSAVVTVFNSTLQGLLTGVRGLTVSAGTVNVITTTVVGNSASALNMTGGTVNSYNSSYSGGTNAVTVTSPAVFKNNASSILSGSFNGTGTNTLLQKGSYISNDSALAGTTVKDALNTAFTNLTLSTNSLINYLVVNSYFVGAAGPSSGVTGSFNFGGGYRALFNLTSGSNNTAVGYSSGYNSGGPSLTNITNCTFLGANATSTTNTLTNSTAIGSGAQITASNQIVLGDGNVTTITTGNASAQYTGKVKNNSGVAGTNVDDALNTLNGSLQNVVFSAYKNAGSVTANTTISSWTNVVADSLSGFNSSTGVFTVPASLAGNNLIVSFGAATTTGTPKGQVYKNGTLVQTCLGSGTQTACPNVFLPNVATNDTITVALDSSLTLTSTNTDTLFSIQATPGSNSRIVKARYHGATGTITSSLSNITFSTMDVDNQSAYSGGTYTIPATWGGGWYNYNFCVYLTATTVAANQVATCAVLQNGSIISEKTQFASSASTKPLQCCVTDGFQFSAGDAITFQASFNGTTNSVSASNVFNYFSIQRQSN